MTHGASAQCVSANEKMLVSAPTCNRSLSRAVGSLAVPACTPNSKSRAGAVRGIRMARLMQKKGIHAKRKRRHPIPTTSHPEHAVAPHLLQQNVTAERPNHKWTGDMTSIPTAEGWLYLAVILDLSSRLVVGWSMSAHGDEPLVEAALRMALARRRPSAGLLHHLDRAARTPAAPLARHGNNLRWS
jgi:transposase InsO family protein